MPKTAGQTQQRCFMECLLVFNLSIILIPKITRRNRPTQPKQNEHRLLQFIITRSRGSGLRSTCMRSPKMAGTVMIRRCFNDEVVAIATAGTGQGRAAVSRCSGAARRRPSRNLRRRWPICRYTSSRASSGGHQEATRPRREKSTKRKKKKKKESNYNLEANFSFRDN